MMAGGMASSLKATLALFALLIAPAIAAQAQMLSSTSTDALVPKYVPRGTDFIRRLFDMQPTTYGCKDVEYCAAWGKKYCTSGYYLQKRPVGTYWCPKMCGKCAKSTQPLDVELPTNPHGCTPVPKRRHRRRSRSPRQPVTYPSPMEPPPCPPPSVPTPTPEPEPVGTILPPAKAPSPLGLIDTNEPGTPPPLPFLEVPAPAPAVEDQAPPPTAGSDDYPPPVYSPPAPPAPDTPAPMPDSSPPPELASPPPDSPPPPEVTYPPPVRSPPPKSPPPKSPPPKSHPPKSPPPESPPPKSPPPKSHPPKSPPPKSPPPSSPPPSSPPPEVTYPPPEESSPPPPRQYAPAAPPEHRELLRLVNEGRAENGKPPLCLNAELSAAAYAHSKDMAERNYFEHNSPDGGTPWKRIKDAGYPEGSGEAENIAAGYGTPEAVYLGWKGSPGHWTNILGDYKHMGVGIFRGGGYRIYWTQTFGGSDNARCLRASRY